MPYHQPRTFEEYCEELEPVLRIIEAEAETSEQLCYLSDRTVATLQDAGLYRMLLPRELAGAELTHLEAMKIIERLAWAHGSTGWRSEEHTSELQSLMRITYAVFCLKKKKTHQSNKQTTTD